MATFSSLEVGRRALLAHNFGLDVTSNNIANTNTEGYSRRQAVFSEAAPYSTQGYYIGTGIDGQSLRSFREEYLDREVRKTNGKETSYKNDVEIFNAIETILREPTDNNLGEVVNNLLNIFEELALQPESIGLREVLLHKAQTLVERFNSASNDLEALRLQTYEDIRQDVTKANKLVEEIAGYNKALGLTKDKNGQDSLTYVDKREVAIEELAKLGNVTVTYDDNRTANVFMNGINLVNQEEAHYLKEFEDIDANTGESTLSVMLYDKHKDLYIDVDPKSGSFYSNLKHYNVTLDRRDSSLLGFSILKEIDNYVSTFAEKINGFLAGAYGLNDYGATAAPGRVLFTSDSGEILASNIKVSSSVSDPADIPLSATAGAPGNSDIARSISRISQDGNFLAGQTPSEFYSNFIGKVANLANDAVNGEKALKLVSQQLNSQRNSIMGVNEDEEAINLIKFQKNFEAASRIITMSNEILSTLVNLGR